MANHDTRALLATLLQGAGIAQPVRAVELLEQGITNRMSIVTLADGGRFVLRQYRWLHGGADDLDRVRKEVFLHDVLRQHAVPVPNILATVEAEDQSAALMEFVTGTLLGDVTPDLAASARRKAWRSCGEMLRRAHAIAYPEGTYGWIVGDHVQRFDAPSWGDFIVDGIIEHLDRVVTRRPDVAVHRARLHDVLARSVPLLNELSPCLLHNDPHPWNVLVHPVRDGWECAAWLDWEYAWVGDRDWDLVRMDLFRRHPIGPTPDAFWDGYGTLPVQPRRGIYELFISLWMANQYLDGDRNLVPTYEAAMAFVDRLDAAVEGIARSLQGA